MTTPIDPRQLTGLTQVEAARRLRAEGYNELPTTARRTVLTIALEVAREPMFLMLVACGTLYLLTGEVGDALMLLGFVFVVMGITIYQERRTERALEALRDLSSPRALVIRDGERQRVAGRDVVRGDLIVVAEGDRVPADALLLYAMNLSADESLLTGESVPVRKQAAAAGRELGRPGGDDLPGIYAGTMVTAGQGVAEVQGTGGCTELGKIGKALQTISAEKTFLQLETGRLVARMAFAGAVLCVVVFVVYGLSRGNCPASWRDGFLAGITMAMAILPEEFPVVLTIFLALGAWRISRSQVLTRRMAAIETLGAATVLCSDKTGTLTQNRMSIRQLAIGPHLFDTNDPQHQTLPETYHALLEFGILASKRDPFDPMEQALRRLGDRYLAKTEHLHDDWELIREYPLSSQLLALSHVWRSPDGQDHTIAAKGAPEAIADLCHFTAAQQAELDAHVAAMGREGLRVLGVARADFKHSDLPTAQHDFQFAFLGLVALADPIRPTVPGAIRECSAAGIRVIMITGDNPVTARSIAQEIGLAHPDNCITGPELEQLSDEELARRIPDVNVFARVVPEQKLRLVTALKANREVVAMTGDGVNDAPALKAAHIGIAMGGRGADVAREASALVLLDDDFASIVRAVRLGRRIFDNIKKAIAYILAVHVPIAGLSVVPVFFRDWPLILLPVHVVFLELIIDPACSVIFEAEGAEPGIMTRPPRSPTERLFSRGTLTLSLLQGFSVLAVTLAVFLVSRYLDQPEGAVRALTFTTLVVANLSLILTNRSWTRSILSMLREPNPALWWVVGGGSACLGLILYVPFLSNLFHFGRLHLGDLAICAAAGVFSIVWFEILKVVYLRRHPG